MDNPDLSRPADIRAEEICPDAEWDDPIVREVREVRERIFAEFNYDLAAYIHYLGELQEEERQRGRVIISTPFPRPQAPQDRARTDAA